LTQNFTRYLNELLAHALEDQSEAERDELVATALGDKSSFLGDVMHLNTELMEAMTKKMAEIVKHLAAVQGGKDLEHQHTETGRIAVNE
jgi:hypothetical protein